MKSLLKKISNLFLPGRTSDACISVTGALILTYAFISRLYTSIYDTQVVLPELFTGTSAFKNYYKPADFLIPRYFILGFLIVFLLLSFWINLHRIYAGHISPVFLFCEISAIAYGVKKYFGLADRSELLFLGGLFLLTVLCFRKKYDELEHLLMLQAVVYFSTRLLLRLAVSFFIISDDTALKYADYLFFAGYLLCILVSLGKSIRILAMARKVISVAGQLILCLFPLTLIRFTHKYYGETFVYKCSSVILPAVLIVLAGATLVIFCTVVKKNEHSSWTFAALGALQIPYIYEVGAFEPINLFHFGELTVPMQQLSMYGKIPYLDFFPIHGMCDYFFQAINQLFLDGSYTSFPFAYHIGSVVLCGIVAYIIYKCIPQKSVALVFILFFTCIGEWYYYFRFIFVLPILLLFFSKPVCEDLFKNIRLYVVSSILSIAWYPAIGGVLAIALLPVLLFRCFSKNGRQQLLSLKEKTIRNTEILRTVPAFILGIAFIPMFIGILRYLKENMGISQFFPGDRLTNSVLSSPAAQIFTIPNIFGDPAVICFSFLVPLMALTIYSVSRKEAKHAPEALTVCTLFCYLICSYTFGTIFAGERALIVTIVLLAFTAYIIWRSQKKHALIACICIVLAMTVNTSVNLTDADLYIAHNVVPEEYIPADGASMGYENLGNGYMFAEERDTLENFAFVIRNLCPEEETYVDFTNQASLYMMTGKSTPFAYGSLYHGTSDETIYRMLESIEANPPHLVLIAPYWKNEGGTAALKNKEIYQYFMEHEYKPYLYKNVCFLTDLDMSGADWAQSAQDVFHEYVADITLQELPISWANSEKAGTLEPVDSTWELISTNSVTQTEDGSYMITGKDPYLLYKVSGPDIFKNGEFIKMQFKSDALTALEDPCTNITLYLTSREGFYNPGASLSFTATNGELLIPLYSMPLWTEQNFSYIRLDIEDERLVGARFSVSCELAKE
nr:hypothetical protein [Lachnospiraceae bacterium]